jgi:hypothetical protein
MQKLNDTEFDAMFRQYLSAELDVHQGRSQRHFRRYLDNASRAAWKRRNWLIGAFITGMAASVAMLWGSPLFHFSTPAAPPSSGNTVASVSSRIEPPVSVSPAVERIVQSQTTDEGVVLLGEDAPFRVLRHQSIEQENWFDQRQNIRAQQVTPREDLVFIKMPTY